MADHVTIDADFSEVLRALDRLGTLAEKYVREASRETAERIADETKRRIPRRAGGPTRTAHTAEGVTIRDLGDRGFLVFVLQPDMHGLPQWLEFGTRHMVAKPALFPAARLEEGAHLRRIIDGLNQAIDEVGLSA